MMKAVMPYDMSPGTRRLVDAVDGAVVRIVPIPESDATTLAREIADADVMLHVLQPVTAELMRRAPKLKLVQKIGIGIDAIDLEHAKANGVAVCNMPGTNTPAVAELALGLMLACLRRIVPLMSDLRAGQGWPGRAEVIDGSGEIGGRCVGLVGYGAVPRKLAPILAAMGARVIAHDPMVRDADIELVPLDELLARADIVSLHVPLTPDTKNLIDAARIAKMKRGAILINTARGPLVDEGALADALRSGAVAAAGLDVLAEEPARPGHPLFSLPNAVVTPHIAWMTDGTWRRSLDVIVENCRRLAAGEPLLHRVV